MEEEASLESSGWGEEEGDVDELESEEVEEGDEEEDEEEGAVDEDEGEEFAVLKVLLQNSIGWSIRK